MIKKIFVGVIVSLLPVIAAASQIRFDSAADDGSLRPCLPTGVCLDPAGRSIGLGNMPLHMILSPEGDRVLVSLSGWRQQGLQVVDIGTGAVTQTISQPSAFLGLVFSHDGRVFYASGGNEDKIYRYRWHDRRAELINAIVLAPKEADKDGTRFPAGMALSNDGRRLYVAENLGDSLAVIDLDSGKVERRLPTDPYPSNVAAAADGSVYVSSWGGNTVSVFKAGTNGQLIERKKIAAGHHPSALLLNREGSRLFVACAGPSSISVIDTRQLRVVATLADPPPAGPRQGSSPDALALSADGARLFVAEADNNAVAVFNLSGTTAGIRQAKGRNALWGRIPVQWYPTALLMTKQSLLVLNGKGAGTAANRGEVQPDTKLPPGNVSYTLGQLNGSLTILPAGFKKSELSEFSRRVARANNWDRRSAETPPYPPFKHVIYIIKENRTYDQILGDLPQGDGDTSLSFFPRKVSPNHHALAEAFGLFDRFFVNAEVSSQGHVWSTAAYVTDYGEKTIPSLYARQRREEERGDVDDPAGGYLWNAAIKKGLTIRNYGEFRWLMPERKNDPTKLGALKAALIPHTSYDYPGGDLKISDQVRADAWEKEFHQFVRDRNLPALQIMHLLGDHTQGARPGRPTPSACMADNDYALGRIVEAVSNSTYWQDTVLFVLEDDAQDGPDHVDSHRSVLLVISAYNRGGVIHRFVNTTDVIATIDEILGLDKLSKFDYYARPLRDIFQEQPQLPRYQAVKPTQRFDELNPEKGPDARASIELELDRVDAADESSFNRILWHVMKGPRPYPQLKRISTLEIARAQ